MTRVVKGYCPPNGEPVAAGCLILERPHPLPGRAPLQSVWIAVLYQDDRRVGVRKAGSVDARIHGSPSRGRRPYYGQVRHIGANWIATLPGDRTARSFPTRAAAKAYLADKGMWA